MRVKKYSFLLTLAVAALTLVIYLAPLPPAFPQVNDIALAIFGSSILVCIVSLAEYFVERRNALERFYHEATKMMHMMQLCGYYFEYENPKPFIESWLDVYRCGSSNLDFSFGDLCFITGNRPLRKIHDEVYSVLRSRYFEVEKRVTHMKQTNNLGIQKKMLHELNEMFYEELHFEGFNGTCHSGREKWEGVRRGLDNVYDLMYLRKRRQMIESH